MKSKFPFYKQPGYKDCGPTCLRIIAKYYGKLISLQQIQDLSETTRAGSNLLKLCDAAEVIGFKTIGVKIDFNKLQEAPLPLIIRWNKITLRPFINKKGVEYFTDSTYSLSLYFML